MNNLLKGLLIEIRPLPTIATITAGIIGFTLTNPTSLPIIHIVLYSLAIFLVMLMVHVHDTYIDYYVRGEDKAYDFGLLDSSNNLISKKQMTAVIIAASASYFLIIAFLALNGGVVFFFLAALGWITGLLYTPYLDRNPILSSFSYPFGVLLTILGAAYLVEKNFPPAVLLYASALMISLGGAKIVEDLIDMEHDPSFGKATVATRLGFTHAKKIGYLTVFIGLASLGISAISQLLTPSILLGLVVGGAIAAASYRFPPIRGVYILVSGLYIVMLSSLLPI